ncbi:hypothetical protein LINPERPRIM_LOCUS4422 [Linum perenne]
MYVTSFGRIPIRASELPILSSPSFGSSSATAASVVVQDGESETESTRNPTQWRSNQTRKVGVVDDDHRLNHRDWKK